MVIFPEVKRQGEGYSLIGAIQLGHLIEIVIERFNYYQSMVSKKGSGKNYLDVFASVH